MSTDTWLSVTNWLYLVSLFAAAVASVALWRLSIASGEEKDRQLDQYKTEAADRIATANATAEVAKGDAAQANAEAARANEAAAGLQLRASQLEKDAAEARAEQERLKLRSLELEAQLIAQGPRNMTVAQAQIISNSVSKESIKPDIILDYFNDAESHRFINILGQAFQSAGLNCSAGSAFVNTIPPGIEIWDQTGVVQRALNAAAIEFKDLSETDKTKPTTIQVGPKSY